MKLSIEIRRPGWMTPPRLRRARPLLLLLALVFAGPVLATDRFSDVPADSVHHANINAIADAGITLGCNAEGTLYCPATVVTRDQMGSFLARAAGLGANPPVANADLLDGIDASGFLPAGDYAVMQMGPWHAVSGPAAGTIEYQPNRNLVVFPGTSLLDVQLALDGPAAVGGIGYGFASARICFFASIAPANVTILHTYVYQGTDTSWAVLVNDDTDRPMGSAACYTVSDSTPTIAAGGTTLLLTLQSTAAGRGSLNSVTTTWTPVSP